MYPRRIICLTEETTETLYLLGEGERVVGISGYTVRPPEAREKPKVSSFLHARYDKIEALEPDLILAFSDLQADITNEFVRRGYPVFTFNQRSVAEILQMICVLGAIVGRAREGRSAGARSRGWTRGDPAIHRDVEEASARVFRRVARPAHLRHSVGRRACRDRRGRTGVPGAAPRAPRKRPSPHQRTGDCGGAGRDYRVVVRQTRA